MRLLKTLGLLLLVSVAAHAQSTAASPEQARPEHPRVSFELRWPESDPQWFEITVEPDGRALYRSQAHQGPGDPDPSNTEVKFTLSEDSRRRIAALGPRLEPLRSTLDKLKVAFTGRKTLRFDSGSGTPTVLSYNYSAAPELIAFTSLMQAISATVELSETLQSQLRFDKLSIDATLRRAEELAANQRLAEMQLIAPVLRKIADDPATLNMARQRARRILDTAAQPHGR